MSYKAPTLYNFTTGNGFPAMPALEDWNGNTPRATLIDGETGSDVTNKQKAIYFTARLNLFDGFNAILGGTGRYLYWFRHRKKFTRATLL